MPANETPAEIADFLEATYPNPMRRGKAAVSLVAVMHHDGSAPSILPRYAHIRNWIKSGATVDVERGEITFPDGCYLKRSDVTAVGIAWAAWLAEAAAVRDEAYAEAVAYAEAHGSAPIVSDTPADLRASGDALTAETFAVNLTAAQASGLAMLADLAYGEQGETAAERDGYAAGQAGAEEIRRALAAFWQG